MKDVELNWIGFSALLSFYNIWPNQPEKRRTSTSWSMHAVIEIEDKRVHFGQPSHATRTPIFSCALFLLLVNYWLHWFKEASCHVSFLATLKSSWPTAESSKVRISTIRASYDLNIRYLCTPYFVILDVDYFLLFYTLSAVSTWIGILIV